MRGGSVETEDPSWGSPHPRLRLLVNLITYSHIWARASVPSIELQLHCGGKSMLLGVQVLGGSGTLLSTDPPSSTVSNLVLTGCTIVS